MMHIIDSGDVAKPVTTLFPLTKLSSNDAYYSTSYRKLFRDDGLPCILLLTIGTIFLVVVWFVAIEVGFLCSLSDFLNKVIFKSG